MRTKFALLLAIGLSVLTLGALSAYALQSHEGMSHGMMREGTHHGMMHEGTMGSGMMGPDMMNQMMEGRKEIEKISAQLRADLRTLADEPDIPAAARKTLEADLDLASRLEGKLEEHHHMMDQMMDHMKNCPMMQSRESGEKSSH